MKGGARGTITITPADKKEATAIYAYAISGSKISEKYLKIDLIDQEKYAESDFLYSFQILTDIHIRNNSEELLVWLQKQLEEASDENKRVFCFYISSYGRPLQVFLNR